MLSAQFILKNYGDGTIIPELHWELLKNYIVNTPYFYCGTTFNPNVKIMYNFSNFMEDFCPQIIFLLPPEVEV